MVNHAKKQFLEPFSEWLHDLVGTTRKGFISAHTLREFSKIGVVPQRQKGKTRTPRQFGCVFFTYSWGLFAYNLSSLLAVGEPYVKKTKSNFQPGGTVSRKTKPTFHCKQKVSPIFEGCKCQMHIERNPGKKLGKCDCIKTIIVSESKIRSCISLTFPEKFTTGGTHFRGVGMVSK